MSARLRLTPSFGQRLWWLGVVGFLLALPALVALMGALVARGLVRGEVEASPGTVLALVAFLAMGGLALVPLRWAGGMAALAWSSLSIEGDGLTIVRLLGLGGARRVPWAEVSQVTFTPMRHRGLVYGTRLTIDVVGGARVLDADSLYSARDLWALDGAARSSGVHVGGAPAEPARVW